MDNKHLIKFPVSFFTDIFKFYNHIIIFNLLKIYIKFRFQVSLNWFLNRQLNMDFMLQAAIFYIYKEDHID